MEKYRNGSRQDGKYNGGQGHAESAAPNEGVLHVYAFIRVLVDQRHAMEALLSQFSEDCQSFVALYEVADENARFYFMHCF